MLNVIECSNIDKHYVQGSHRVEVLKNLNFSVSPSEHIAIVGASGSGKSTLLNVLGGLDQPSAGEVKIKGQPFSSLKDNARGRIRNESMGFVYQFHHLLGEFTAFENVLMPLLIAGRSKAQAAKKVDDLLQSVGMTHRKTHKPSALSGGERQRVAIARALANDPACVLMDEPTGNLDGESAAAVQQLMHELSDRASTAFIVVTHDLTFAKTMDTIYRLDSGRLNRQETQA